jgi:hypothetical protein
MQKIPLARDYLCKYTKYYGMLYFIVNCSGKILANETVFNTDF